MSNNARFKADNLKICRRHQYVNSCETYITYREKIKGKKTYGYFWNRLYTLYAEVYYITIICELKSQNEDHV